MNLYRKAENQLKEQYDINLLEEIVLARNDRAVYYVEFQKGFKFTKIHGKSPMDSLNEDASFSFQYLEDNFDLNSKYGEVAGKEYYKRINLDAIKNLKEEVNVTIPIIINNQRFWIRFHLYKTLLDDNGHIVLASCYITDVTKYLVNEEALYEKTHKDELTGLFNRYALYYHFELHGHRTPVSSFYFDIDDFKIYNDTYGHEVGDKVLVALADKLKILTNDNFNCYRLGGDEFYCLLFNATKDEIQNHNKMISDSIKDITIPGVKEKLSLSIGNVTAEGDITHKKDAFMREGDRLMYVSKKNGKNTSTFGEFIVF